MMAPNAVDGVSRLEREKLTLSLEANKSASDWPIVLPRQKGTRLSLKSGLCAEDLLRRFDIAACKNGVSISHARREKGTDLFLRNKSVPFFRPLFSVFFLSSPFFFPVCALGGIRKGSWLAWQYAMF